MKNGNSLPLSPRGFPQATAVLCRWQKLTGILIVVLLLLWGCFDWQRELLILNAILTVFYLGATLYRLLCIHRALNKPREIIVSPAELANPPSGNNTWPRYLVLLPLYREAEILPRLISNMQQLDYPTDRLEIRLLIEEDDTETRKAAESLHISPPFAVKLIPPSLPRTKPKACNLGFADAAADYLVIYDAEDRPQPSQLKAAALAFSRCPENIACLQAKLGYFNDRANLLTRCFTAEYATWFGLSLPGLDSLEAPIPLGGTSNHFRYAVLRELGGWDEYNVTEDCDLGIRLFAAGYRTRIIDSTTLEQACDNLPGWLRQRSRWVKGYLQTYFVHTRNLIGLHRKLGFWNSLQFHLLIGGSVLSQLLNPLYWLMTIAWLIFRPAALGQFFPWPIFLMGSFCLFIGNFIFIYTGAIACLQRRLGHLVPACLLMPFYWLLISLAAWKGVSQLFTRPHFWEKTSHIPVAGGTPSPNSPPALSPAPDSDKNAVISPTAEVGMLPMPENLSPEAPRTDGRKTKWLSPIGLALFLIILGFSMFEMLSDHHLAARLSGYSRLNPLEQIITCLRTGHPWGLQALLAFWEIPQLAVLGNLLGSLIPLPGSSPFNPWLDCLCLLFFFWQIRLWQKASRRPPLYFPLLLFCAFLNADLMYCGISSWLPAFLILLSARFQDRLNQDFTLTDFTVYAVILGLLALCGPGGLVAGFAAILLGLPLCAARNPGRSNASGYLCCLCLPFLMSLLMLLLWNHLIFGNCLFAWQSYLARLRPVFGNLPHDTALLAVGVFLILSLLPFISTRSRRHPVLEQVLCLLCLTAPVFAFKHSAPYVILTFLILLPAAAIFYYRPAFNKLIGLSVICLVGFYAIGLDGRVRTQYNRELAEKPKISDITAELEQWGAGECRIMTYGTTIPLLYPDYTDTRFCARMQFSRPELEEMGKQERVFIIIPPPDDTKAYAGLPYEIRTFDQTIQRSFFLTKRWENGWRLLEFLPESSRNSPEI